MADSILNLKNKLRGLSVETQAIAQKLHSADRHYLALLGKTARQQLILACYQVCTTQYPEEFLDLTPEQKQTLQNKVKALGLELQQNLLGVLDSALDKQPKNPDSFQEFIISSLFSNAKISRKRRRNRKGKAKKGSDFDGGDFDGDSDLGENNRTLVVLSDEIASEELSETGLSPERLAEALANALESVMGEDSDEDGSDESKKDNDPKGLNDEEGEEKRNENNEDIEAENIDENFEEGPVKVGALDEFIAEEKNVSSEDFTDEIYDRDDEVNSEGDQQDLETLESEQELGDLEKDREGSEETEGDRDANQDPDNTSSSSDVSSSFLGEYFAEKGPEGNAGDEKNGADGNEVASIASKNQPLVIQPKSESTGLSTLGLASLSSSLPDTPPVDITKSEVPFDVIQWQRSWERLVLSSLQKTSYRTNRLLRTSKAIPEPLANPFIEGDLSLSRESSSKTPNLLALTIEPTKAPPFGDRPTPMRVVAVHLNLSDLELVNPELRRRSLKIRKLFSQLETLNQQHQDIQKKLNIAQADMEWRSSWSDDS
ncbi:MAG: hypothetical protein ACFCA4_13935 [Cyanophyceae cyanobacterium]